MKLSAMILLYFVSVAVILSLEKCTSSYYDKLYNNSDTIYTISNNDTINDSIIILNPVIQIYNNMQDPDSQVYNDYILINNPIKP